MRAARQGAALLSAAVGVPLGLALLAVRPAHRERLGERLGGLPRLDPGATWVHAASVGEVLAASRLVAELERRGERVLASATTATGRATLERLGIGAARTLLPVDHPWCVDRALGRARPGRLALVETELWPFLIGGARDRGIPVAVVSARISDRALPRYRRLRTALAGTLGALARVGARTDEDAARFVSLGVPEQRVSITGDLKLEPPPAPVPPPADLVASFAGRPLLVAGSTHPGEEQVVLSAFEQVLAGLSEAGWRKDRLPALLLAPRHPERADAVERMVSGRGRAAHRRSRLPAGRVRGGEVVVLDTVGELAVVYALAASTFVGGSLVPVGGHNVLEPVFAGRPVAFGPHTGSVGAGLALLLETGAGRRVHGPGDLAGVLLGDLLAPAEAAAAVARARDLLAAHRGAAVRNAELLLALPRAPSRRPARGRPGAGAGGG